ncbi:hypothetical protein V6N11_053885 [Hibiscus sabdariffa]|uniref:Uncharacterized protein n=1 Tax=Hibiscus sabdariffa TaxID=183260 RepID=A0ABR2S297_9ROSI
MIVTEKCDVYSNNIMLSDILDPPVSLPSDRRVAKDIIFAASVAFACLRTDPKLRPTMKRVSQEFLSQKRVVAGLPAICRSCTQPRPTDHNFRVSSHLVLMLLLNVRQSNAVPLNLPFKWRKATARSRQKKEIKLVWIHRWPHSKY